MNDQNTVVNGENIKILHIDDDESFLELFKSRVERSERDIEIISIEEPEKCFEKLDEEEVDCIVSDYQYPETTGLDLFEEVREEYPNIPFVVLTGQGSEKVASQAISEGVSDYFLKDEVVKKHDILFKRIENMVARYRAEMEKKRVLERGSDGYFGLDEDWTFTYLNETAQSILGRSKCELLGEEIWDIYESILGTEFEEKFREAMNERRAVTFEGYFPPEREWYRAHVYPTQGGISVYFQDITDLKERQEVLDKKVRQQKAVAELSRYAIEDNSLESLMDEAARRVAEALDNEYGKVLDLQPDKNELLLSHGVGWDEGMVGNATVSASEAADSQASYTLSTEEPVVVEDVDKEDRFSGSTLFDSGDVKSGISTIIGSVDDPWGILGTHSVEPKNYSQDDVKFVQTVANLLAEAIEEEKRKQRIKESRRKYRTLVENFPHGSVSLYDENLKYMAVGGGLFDKLDVDVKDLQDGKVGDTVPDDIAEKLRSNYREVLDGEERQFEIEVEDRELKFWVYPVTDDSGEVYAGLAISRDMSYVREKEEESKIRKKALETVADGVYILDDDRRFVFVNQAFCDLIGRERGEIIGEKAPVAADEEITQRINNIQEDLDPGEVGHIEIEITDSDGDNIPVEIRFTRFSIQGIDEGRIGVVRDIGERKKREERLEEFGSLISHDLRNPLNLAKGHLDLAKETGQEDDLQVVQKAHNRMESIIDELMLITMQRDKVEKTDVHVRSAFEEAFYFAGDSETTYKVEEDLEVRAERSGLISMFENLISNSIEHNDEKIHIEVGPLDNGVFYYEDDGQGVDESEKGKIFNYGFTTSEEGRGLGMPVVRHIAEVNSWNIEVTDSEEGGFRLEVR